MSLHEPVRSLMTPDPHAIQVGAPLREVQDLLSTGGFHHVPILDGETLVGILSPLDLARVSLEAWVGDVPTARAEADARFALRDVMSTEPEVVQAGDPLHEAASRLSAGDFHALPVLDGDRLVGMITSTDLVRALLVDPAAR